MVFKVVKTLPNFYILLLYNNRELIKYSCYYLIYYISIQRKIIKKEIREQPPIFYEFFIFSL